MCVCVISVEFELKKTTLAPNMEEEHILERMIKKGMLFARTEDYLSTLIVPPFKFNPQDSVVTSSVWHVPAVVLAQIRKQYSASICVQIFGLV